jgi:3-dehydroquinate synthetase
MSSAVEAMTCVPCDVEGALDSSKRCVECDEYHTLPPPSFADRAVECKYIQVPSIATGGDASLLETLLEGTPLPKGRSAFSSVHVVGPPVEVAEGTDTAVSESIIAQLLTGAAMLGRPLAVHRLPSPGYAKRTNAVDEYNAIFAMAEKLILEGADRGSLLVYVGSKDLSKDAYAAFIAMLPFRGISVALVTQGQEYGDLLRYQTSSGVFEVNARDACRMGMFPVRAVFGPLASKTSSAQVAGWQPVEVPEAYDEDEKDAVLLPFKIGGLDLPMVTHTGAYHDAIATLASALAADYADEGGYFPIVSCGETCDALGYGADVLDSLGEPFNYLFVHRSGETYKRYDEYGRPELLRKIATAKEIGRRPVIIAVGGGVNGNCIGLIAALTGADFIEVPTTPMHYNDATTSAKKAFSLVKDDVILSKNILGAFYLPRLVFCVNDMLLTISSANAHATVGEACKTMNMLGVASSSTGAADYHNILGAVEFASDFTKIVKTVRGFDRLVKFIEDPTTHKTKSEVLAAGRLIAELRQPLQVVKKRASSDNAGKSTEKSSQTTVGKSSEDVTSSDLDVSTEQEQSREVSGEASECRTAEEEEAPSPGEGRSQLRAARERRAELMKAYRSLFKELPGEDRLAVKEFLTVVNAEVVKAKAMFLAYSDPFEKYRALLFEYAHTLGHGVEAFANLLYARAQKEGIEVPEDALRLHGQCVGMAVLWAGQISSDLGALTGHGLELHQAFVYLFNRQGGFSFAPLRKLCDQLRVSKEEFCEGVLRVVRVDNKRGYVNSADPAKSVDQLVAERPGKMLRSDDVSAELRYLVEVDERWQHDVLCRAFDGDFDRVADLDGDRLKFVASGAETMADSHEVGLHLHSELQAVFA